MAHSTLPKTRYQNPLYKCSWINTQESNIYQMQKSFTQRNGFLNLSALQHRIIQPNKTKITISSATIIAGYQLKNGFNSHLFLSVTLDHFHTPRNLIKLCFVPKNNFTIEGAIGSHPNNDPYNNITKS